MKRIKNMIIGELKGIIRDPALLMLFFAPIMIFLLISYGFPFIIRLIQIKTGFDASGYSCASVAYMSFLPALMAGMLSGLVIIDERDEGLIYYFAVTPLSKSGYLLNKVIFCGALAFLSSLLLLIFNLFCAFPVSSSLAASVLFTAEALLFALFFAVFASNKIEAMAMGKFLGIMTAGPLIAWLAPYPWKYISLFFVTGFPAMILYEGNNTAARIIFLITGAAVHALLIFVLFNKWMKRAA